MRLLIALLFMVPAFGQQTPAAAEQQTKPEQQGAAQAPAQEPAKADDQSAKPKADEPAANPAPSTESWFSGSIDFGYRYIPDFSGNRNVYRSILDLGQGPRLTALDFTLTDPKKRLFDRMDVRANGWGGDPYNTAWLSARKSGWYDLTLDYRNIAYFNAVPSFANPSAPAGFDEQSFDVHRRNFTGDLELLPGKHITPYLAFDHNSGYGNGITDWVPDQNDNFAVPTLLRDSTNNYRGGVRFQYNRFHITLEQGGTTFKDDDSASESGLTLGDRTSAILGQTLDLTSLHENYGIRGTSIYTKAQATTNPFSWLDLYGQFVFSEPKVTVNYSDIATGNFVLLNSLLFYSGQQNLGTGAANQPHTTGSAGFEMRPRKWLRILDSWMTDRYHDAAAPFVTQSYTTGTSGAITVPAAPSSIAALNYSQVVNYNQEQVDVIASVTSRLTLRGGYRFVWGDATVLAGQLSQSGPLVSGQLHRNVGLAGLNYRMTQRLSVNLDYEGSSSDHIYFRTSLNDYQKGRARARYQFNNALTVQARFTALDNQNPDPSIRYSLRAQDTALSVFWTPKEAKRISLMGEYDRSTVNSQILYLGNFLAQGTSIYRDNAHSATAAMTVALPKYPAAKVVLGGSFFTSDGSRTSHYYQPLVQLSVPIEKHLYWNTEWKWYGYAEDFYQYEAFRTNVFISGFRLVR